jgi:hypothetical protein
VSEQEGSNGAREENQAKYDSVLVDVKRLAKQLQARVAHLQQRAGGLPPKADRMHTLDRLTRISLHAVDAAEELR